VAESRLVIIVALMLGVAAATATGVFLFSYRGGSGNVGHVQNVLIIASITGFNDSANHGVPQNPWPVVHTTLGTTLNFTVMNVDHQAHGFNVAYYHDNSIVAIPPGQTIHVSFVASKAGTFQIYCEIPCTVHWAMQSGELIVS
jgi:plastocyanin